jgi:hypothetical protein
MSTVLAFSRKKGLRSRDGNRRTTKGRNVVELDTILSRDQKIEPTSAGDYNENESRTTPTSVSGFSFHEQKGEQRQGVAHFQRVPVEAFCSNRATPPRHEEADDSKSSGATSIVSGDITVVSDHLIANIQHIQDVQNLLNMTATPSPTDYTPEPSFKSAQKILCDLAAKLSSMLGDERVYLDATSTSFQNRRHAFHENRSFLDDVEEEGSARSGLLGHGYLVDKMKADHEIMIAHSSRYSIK